MSNLANLAVLVQVLHLESYVWWEQANKGLILVELLFGILKTMDRLFPGRKFQLLVFVFILSNHLQMTDI